MQVPDSDERDVIFTFKRALLECEPSWIENMALFVVDFASMARAIGQLCRKNVVVVLGEFQYFVRNTLYAFNSFLQAEIDNLRGTGLGGVLVLGSIQTEMQALLNDKGAPLHGRATHHLEVEHWYFEDLLQVFRAQGVEDPRAWLTLWSFFEGVPKFYRDARDFGKAAGCPWPEYSRLKEIFQLARKLYKYAMTGTPSSHGREGRPDIRKM